MKNKCCPHKIIFLKKNVNNYKKRKEKINQYKFYRNLNILTFVIMRLFIL